MALSPKNSLMVHEPTDQKMCALEDELPGLWRGSLSSAIIRNKMKQAKRRDPLKRNWARGCSQCLETNKHSF